MAHAEGCTFPTDFAFGVSWAASPPTTPRKEPLGGTASLQTSRLRKSYLKKLASPTTAGTRHSGAKTFVWLTLVLLLAGCASAAATPTPTPALGPLPTKPTARPAGPAPTVAAPGAGAAGADIVRAGRQSVALAGRRRPPANQQRRHVPASLVARWPANRLHPARYQLQRSAGDAGRWWGSRCG